MTAFFPLPEAGGVAPQYYPPRPISIPLSSSNREQQARNVAKLHEHTGFTVDQIKAFADTEGLRLRRTGKGRGTRYVLYLDDFEKWLRGLPTD